MLGQKPKWLKHRKSILFDNHASPHIDYIFGQSKEDMLFFSNKLLDWLDRRKKKPFRLLIKPSRGVGFWDLTGEYWYFFFDITKKGFSPIFDVASVVIMQLVLGFLFVLNLCLTDPANTLMTLLFLTLCQTKIYYLIFKRYVRYRYVWNLAHNLNYIELDFCSRSTFHDLHVLERRSGIGVWDRKNIKKRTPLLGQDLLRLTLNMFLLLTSFINTVLWVALAFKYHLMYDFFFWFSLLFIIFTFLSLSTLYLAIAPPRRPLVLRRHCTMFANFFRIKYGGWFVEAGTVFFFWVSSIYTPFNFVAVVLSSVIWFLVWLLGIPAAPFALHLLWTLSTLKLYAGFVYFYNSNKFFFAAPFIAALARSCSAVYIAAFFTFLAVPIFIMLVPSKLKLAILMIWAFIRFALFVDYEREVFIYFFVHLALLIASFMHLRFYDFLISHEVLLSILLFMCLKIYKSVLVFQFSRALRWENPFNLDLVRSSDKIFQFKTYFKLLYYYSMPDSVLFEVRKRLNLVFMLTLYFPMLFFSVL